MMKTKIIAIAIFALLISNIAFAAEGDKPSSTKTITVQQKLEVIQIDHDARWFRLKDRSGFARRFEAGEEIRNFDQLSVGDIVNVNFVESITIEAFGPDAINLGAESEAVFGRAAEGQKPGVAGAKTVVLVVTIAEIDLDNSLVTLKDKQGNTKTFSPSIPANLTKVKVGDKVAISVTKALAISVEAGDK